MMKPAFSQVVGPLGENMHFFFFKSTGKNGSPIADARGDGHFTIALQENRFRIRLPLSALLPPQPCPVDGELLRGGWKYCPWHGTALD